MYDIRLERRKDGLYQIIDVKPWAENKGALTPACQSLCGKKMRRFHFTCLFCRLRRVYYGKMPKEIRVTPYLLLIWKDRKNAKIKNVILKKLLTLCEFLAN